MGGDLNFLDIILFAAIAAFLVMRLVSVLGKRTGHEKKNTGFDPFTHSRNGGESADEKVIHLPERGRAGGQETVRADEVLRELETSGSNEFADADAASGMTQIRLADRSFDPEEFVNGARVAFEMILNAFSAGDVETLRPLLADDVFREFAGAIEARKANNHTLETTLVGLSEARIVAAELKDRAARVTVRFVSEQVNVTRDEEGRIIDGDPGHVDRITDLWTFARDTASGDPNWVLEATASEE